MNLQRGPFRPEPQHAEAMDPNPCPALSTRAGRSPSEAMQDERAAAVAQINRTLRAWRKAGDAESPAGGAIQMQAEASGKSGESPTEAEAAELGGSQLDEEEAKEAGADLALPEEDESEAEEAEEPEAQSADGKPIQRAAAPHRAARGKASSDSSPGSPLPEPLSKQMGTAFGADFSDVRVHEGSAAATRFGALAFTRGNSVHFAPGKYDPESKSGRALLGHELTHVVQQQSGKVTAQGKAAPFNRDPSLENEADVLGEKASQGEPVTVAGAASGAQAKQSSAAPIQLQLYDAGEFENMLTAAARNAKALQKVGNGKYTRAKSCMNPIVTLLESKGADREKLPQLRRLLSAIKALPQKAQKYGTPIKRLEEKIAEVEAEDSTDKDLRKKLAAQTSALDKKGKPGGAGSTDAKEEKLTPQEQANVVKYKSAGGEAINDVLRDKRKMKQGDFDHAALLSMALAKLPKHDGPAYRGAGTLIGGLSSAAELKPGNVYEEPGFLSTAASKGKAFQGKFKIVIESPKTLVDISVVQSEAPDLIEQNLSEQEAEVIGPPGRKLRYLGKTEDGWYRYTED